MEAFRELIAHKKCMRGLVEDSEYFAYRMDGPDGIGCSLGFGQNELSSADYLISCDEFLKIQLIELSDMNDAIEKCRKNHIALANRAQSSKEKREVTKRAWLPVTSEIANKWSGSIAIVERWYRKKTLGPVVDPVYLFLLVCKNGTDPIALDILKERLRGKIVNIEVCETQGLSDFLVNKVKSHEKS